METRRVGRSGLTVSRLGLGTIAWGRDTDEHEAREQLELFADAGGTLVDCAPEYGDGQSEDLLGRLLGHAVAREQLVLSGRAGLRWRGDELVHDTGRGSLLDQLDSTLKRLGTDYLDLWVVHGYSPGVPREETLATLDAAVASGRARYTGVALESGWQLGWTVAHQQRWPGRVAPVAVQAEYSLLRRDVEAEVAPAASDLGLGLVAVSSLGRGVLTGKYRSGVPADSRGASPHLGPFVKPYLGGWAQGIVEAVATAADGLALSPLEVALAWVRDRPGVACALVGARTAAQLRGVLAVESVSLPQEITDALEEVSAG